MNGLTLTPFVKVKLSSSYQHLYIDLGAKLGASAKTESGKPSDTIANYH